MLKQELYRIFIKNKLLLISLIYLVGFTVFQFVNTVTIDYGASMELNYFYCSGVNWVLLFVIMIMIKQLYITDYECKTEGYVLTSPNGRVSLNVYKILIVLFMSFILSLASQFIMIGVSSATLNVLNTDLKYLDFQFTTATREITTVEAVTYGAFITVLGYIIISLRFILLAVLTKNTTGFFALCVAVVIAPTFVINDYDIMLRLPLGSSFIYGMPYFKGESVAQSADGPVAVYREILDNEFLLILIAQIVITVLALVLAMLIINRKFSFIRLRKVSAAALAVVMLVSVSGCATEPEEETDRYIRVGDYTFWDNEQQEEIVILNHFFSTKKIHAIDGNYAIVSEQVSGSDNAFTIKKVDLRNFGEEAIVTLGAQHYRPALLGLESLIIIPNFLSDGYFGATSAALFSYYDGKAYFGGQDEIVEIDLSNGKETVYPANGTVVGLSVGDMGFAYQSAETSKWYLNDKIISESDISSLYSTEHKLYYTEFDEEYKNVVKVYTEDGKTEILDESGDIIIYYADDNKVIYYKGEDGMSTNSFILLKDGKSEVIPYSYVCANESYIVVRDIETEEYITIE